MSELHRELVTWDASKEDFPLPSWHRKTTPAAPEPIASMPGLLRRAANLAGAAIRHVAAGMPAACPEVKAARLAICSGCPQFDDGTCRVCGCLVDIKTGWAGEACPEGKWDAVGPASVSELPPTAAERLEPLVLECDYRGPQVAGQPGGCGCNARWLCGMARGDDPAHPFEVNRSRCLRCVAEPTGADPPASSSSGS